MPEISKRLATQKRLTSLLELTPWDGGTLAGKVFRGRKFLPSDAGATMLSLLEAPKPDFAPEGGGSNRLEQKTAWIMLLQGFLPDDPENPTDNAYELMAAAELQLSRIVVCGNNGSPSYPDDYLLGKLVAGITIGPGVVRPPDKEISNTAFFYTPLVIEFISNPAKPYVTVE